MTVIPWLCALMYARSNRTSLSGFSNFSIADFKTEYWICSYRRSEKSSVALLVFVSLEIFLRSSYAWKFRKFYTSIKLGFSTITNKLYIFLWKINGPWNLNKIYCENVISNYNFHIAQNITERCQEYYLYFIAIEILSQHFCQILQNIS